MNIYRVTDLDTGKEWTGSTDEVMERLYINKDNLFWHVKRNSPYLNYLIEKIGTDGRAKKPKKIVPDTTTKINTGIDEDLRQARLLGLNYGEYKNLQLMRG